MSGAPGRPGPLRYIVQEGKGMSRRSKSRYATAEPSASPMPMKSPISRQPTPQPTPTPETRYEQAPTGAKPGMTQSQQFRLEYSELYDLPPDFKIPDLPKEQQILYPAQFAGWKEEIRKQELKT